MSKALSFTKVPQSVSPSTCGAPIGTEVGAPGVWTSLGLLAGTRAHTHNPLPSPVARTQNGWGNTQPTSVSRSENSGWVGHYVVTKLSSVSSNVVFSPLTETHTGPDL